MFRVDTRPNKRNSARPAWKVQKSYLQWLRGRRCACGGKNPDCGGPIQAAHTPDVSSGGMATKTADHLCIPLSEGCHIRTQHRIGWPKFAAAFLPGPVEQVRAAYWQQWTGDKGELANG
jgi:hypothetical protein